jgi:large subunit ribosomal protein L24
VTMEAPLHVSNVQLVDPVNGAPVRVTYRYLEDGTKVRVSTGGSASGSIIPRPAILRERRKPRSLEVGTRDTPKEIVLEKTLDPSSGRPGLPELFQ